MELNFIKNEATRYWECEFEATADFNLHIEGVPEGKVWIYQRTTASGEYAYIKEATPYPSLVDVYDFDFSALIYPKFVKVVCGTEPTYAEVVSNGEITELKYQEKSVEVTANGNTEVIPDAGFAGLTKVNVSVNVPQSGGGNSGGRGLEYLDFRENEIAANILPLLADVLASKHSYIGFTIGPSAFVTSQSEEYGVKAIAGGFNFNAICQFEHLGVNRQTVKDAVLMIISLSNAESDFLNGMTPEEFLASIPRLTEEEFYNLNA